MYAHLCSYVFFTFLACPSLSVSMHVLLALAHWFGNCMCRFECMLRMCAPVSVCMCMSACMWAYISVKTIAYQVHENICMGICICMCMHVAVCAYTNGCICMWACVFFASTERFHTRMSWPKQYNWNFLPASWEKNGQKRDPWMRLLLLQMNRWLLDALVFCLRSCTVHFPVAIWYRRQWFGYVRVHKYCLRP